MTRCPDIDESDASLYQVSALGVPSWLILTPATSEPPPAVDIEIYTPHAPSGRPSAEGLRTDGSTGVEGEAADRVQGILVKSPGPSLCIGPTTPGLFLLPLPRPAIPALNPNPVHRELTVSRLFVTARLWTFRYKNGGYLEL